MPTVSEYKAQAEQLEREGQLEKARTIYKHLVTHLEGSPAMWKELNLFVKAGDLAVELGDPEDAVQLYERCAERHAEQGNTDQVIELCGRVVEAQPDQTAVYKRLAAKLLEHDYVEPARLLLLAMARRTGREKTIKQLEALARHKPPMIRAAIEKAFIKSEDAAREEAEDAEGEDLEEVAPEEEAPEEAAADEPLIIRTAQEEMRAAHPPAEDEEEEEEEEEVAAESGEGDLLVSRSFDEELAAVAPPAPAPPGEAEKKPPEPPRAVTPAAPEPEPEPEEEQEEASDSLLSVEEAEAQAATEFAQRFSMALPRDEPLGLDEVGGFGPEKAAKKEPEPEPEPEPKPPRRRPVRRAPMVRRRSRRGLWVTLVLLVVAAGAAALVVTGTVPLDSLPFVGGDEPAEPRSGAAGAESPPAEAAPPSDIEEPLLPDPEPVIAPEAFPPLLTSRRAPSQTGQTAAAAQAAPEAAPRPPILVVAGLPIERVEDLGSGGGYRVSHRLESGAPLTLVVLPGAPIPAPVVDAVGDTAVGMIQRGRMNVIARAVVTPAAMRGLLERIVEVARP